MRWPIIALAVCGLAGLAGVLFVAGQSAMPRREMARAVQPAEPPPPDAPIASPSTTAPPRAQPMTRAIVPDIVAAPEVDRNELVRVEPRAPLSPIGRADRHGKDGPRPSILFQPVAIAAGIVKSKGFTVQLAGLEIVPANEKCSANGREWNCGVVARTAFRNYLRGRALSCVLPDEGARSVTLACTLGKEDPALWLARYGWARAGADGAYADAVDEARRQRLGIFGPPPQQSGQSG